MPQIQDAIILLAGVGQRLKPLTDNTHKALIQIGNQTILKRQLQSLQNQGIQNFHLALGHRSDDLKSFIADHFSHLNCEFYTNQKYDVTNTAYSLWQVLQNMNEGFLLLDGDVVFAESLIQSLLSQTGKSVLLCENDQNKLDPEAVKFKTNSQNQIIDIGKHIALDVAQGESIGIGQFQKDWNKALTRYFNDCLQNRDHWQWYYEDAFQKILSANQAPSALYTLATEPHPWVEVDDHNDFKRAQMLFG